MTIRRATEADRDALVALWDEFSAELPVPPWVEGARDGSVAGIDASLAAGLAFVAEEGDTGPVGFACGAPPEGPVGEVTELYVRPGERRRGSGRALLGAVAEALGTPYLRVTVAGDNDEARRLYERAGFRLEKLDLVAAAEALAAEVPKGPSFGSIHVQSDDEPAVERAVRQFVPRLPGGSRGSLVAPPRNGWIAVYDDVCDRDPVMLRRLARELSDRMGAVVLALGLEEGAVVRFVLHDRGSVMDEYLSVQEYYGPLPPGDVVALAANPRVVARLTGADPEAVRAASVHAASPHDLPPARETLAAIAAAIGVAGAEHGYGDAPEIPGAVRIERA